MTTHQPAVDPGCPSTRRHGTAVAYDSDRCRCPNARRIANLGRERRRTTDYPGGTTDATGTHRRIQALMSIGWRKQDIGDHLGVSDRTIGEYMVRPRALRRTAAAVERVYRNLADTPGPSAKTAARARALRYAPPLAWDDTIDDPTAQPVVGAPGDDGAVDEVAVMRLAAGTHNGRIRRPDRDEFIRRTAATLPTPEQAWRIRQTPREVTRIRVALGVNTPRVAPQKTKPCAHCSGLCRRRRGEEEGKWILRMYCSAVCTRAARPYVRRGGHRAVAS